MTDPLRAAPEDRTPAELLAFGVVNLDKPAGPSAHQVAGWVRDLASDAVDDLAASASAGDSDADQKPPATTDTPTVDRAAHAGTLDPKVTGCLPMLLGDATRMAQVFLEGRKEYVAVLELHGPQPADFESVLDEFEAPLYQKPPRKSAVSRKLRVREIYALDLLDHSDRQALIRIECESGTYVRKLCHDLGLALGTGAHMGHLRRTATDPFNDTSLVDLHELTDALAFAREGDTDRLREVVQPAERAFDHLPSVVIVPSAAREVATGAPVYAPGVIDGPEASDDDPLVACYTPNGSAVCLGTLVGDPDGDSGVVVDLERVLV
ncbi:RNA-guided pseudouridylation complex pseudouridine synthase subunit Cbf5 [Halonotius terrestris]|uniref:Probable tRNA pseudouridine synthase B n=1 Tax=Halonotius terrestris TaxID=2487750 RepID=A0A8J8PBN9_9EURY|nr:RNA-guided pseudouridylation complex pseudouridine synthase subunit Cbf5 [Halonotius terrestris]TQQ81072.1 RNA-guided pseudouridylation complex pseudouridine synthase subunit Cbf5 [Halonotius terrestris]